MCPGQLCARLMIVKLKVPCKGERESERRVLWDGVSGRGEGKVGSGKWVL